MTQTYTDPVRITRMREGKCPECGDPPDQHGGWGGRACSLTDNGVAERIYHQRQLDAARAGDFEALSPLTQLVFRTLSDGRAGAFTSKLAAELAQPEWATQDAVNLLHAAGLIDRGGCGWRIAEATPNRASMTVQYAAVQVGREDTVPEDGWTESRKYAEQQRDVHAAPYVHVITRTVTVSPWKVAR